MDSKLVRLSKKLSWILRHGAIQLNSPISSDGYIYVEDLLKIDSFSNVTMDQIVKVVENNDKKRFILTQDPEKKWKIRACQGHTMELPDMEFTPVTCNADAPVVVHGTTKHAWNQIKNEGLSRMSRQHIHFCPGIRGSNDIISGYRASSEVLIYIDIDKAIKGGIQFFRSANNVILSPGDERGFIIPKYFKKVVHI